MMRMATRLKPMKAVRNTAASKFSSFRIIATIPSPFYTILLLVPFYYRYYEK